MTEPALAQHVKGKGRHYTHPETGELVPSITNIIGVLDKPAMPRWAAKVVAEQAWTLRHTLDSLGEAEAVDVLKGAPWRKSERAADRGTTIHDYLQAAALGNPLPVVDGEAALYRKAADDFLTTYKPVFELVEFTVFGPGYAGTGDFIATIYDRLVVGDYKTSKGLYPEIALQLAALANADMLADGSPVPTVEGALGVLLTPKGVVVKEVDLSGAFAAFQGCLDAWRWKFDRPARMTVLEAV